MSQNQSIFNSDWNNFHTQQRDTGYLIHQFIVEKLIRGGKRSQRAAQTKQQHAVSEDNKISCAQRLPSPLGVVGNKGTSAKTQHGG